MRSNQWWRLRLWAQYLGTTVAEKRQRNRLASAQVWRAKLQCVTLKSISQGVIFICFFRFLDVTDELMRCSCSICGCVRSHCRLQGRPLWLPGWRRLKSREWRRSTAGWRTHQTAGDRTWPTLGWWAEGWERWDHLGSESLLPWHWSVPWHRSEEGYMSTSGWTDYKTHNLTDFIVKIRSVFIFDFSNLNQVKIIQTQIYTHMCNLYVCMQAFYQAREKPLISSFWNEMDLSPIARHA